MFLGAEGLLSSGWEPPSGYAGPRVGQYVAATTEDALATLLELPPSMSRQRTRSMLRDWLQRRLDSMDSAVLSAPVSFLYLVLRPEKEGLAEPGVVKVAEFGYGTEPVAPDTWTSVPLADLVARVLEDLGHEA